MLVVGADFVSRITDPDRPQTAALFGDGAGAVVLARRRPAPGGSGRSLLRADASAPRAPLPRRASGATIEMDGHETFKHAVARMAEVTHRGASRPPAWRSTTIDLFVYHQANARILSAVGERLGLDDGARRRLHRALGNMSAASLPLALAVAARDGPLRDGARVLLAAFGAGFTWGGARRRVGARDDAP